MPGDLNDFRTCNAKSEVVINSSSYSLGFGLKSGFDTATEDLYKDYGDKFDKKENAKSYFSMLTRYQEDLGQLD